MADPIKKTLVSNATVAATNAPDGFEAMRWTECWFAVRMPTTSTPVGTITLSGSINGTDYAPLAFDPDEITGLAEGVTWNPDAPDTITISSPASAVSLLYRAKRKTPHLKITWTRTSGGHSSGLYIEAALQNS